MLQEVIYLHKFLANLGYPQTAPTPVSPVFADNETSISWSEGSVGGSERAKHIDLRIHFVYEVHTAGHLELRKLDSKVNAADILTKASTPPDVFLGSPPPYDGPLTLSKRLCVSQEVQSVLTNESVAESHPSVA